MLKRTNHNGFPIVDVGKHSRCTFFVGLLLKRQLLAVLRERVWELQAKGLPLTEHGRNRFMGSAFTKATEEVHARALKLNIFGVALIGCSAAGDHPAAPFVGRGQAADHRSKALHGPIPLWYTLPHLLMYHIG